MLGTNRRATATWHRRLGLISAPLVVVEAITVLGLNHQTLIYNRVTKQGPKWLLQLTYNLHDGWFWGQPWGLIITDTVAWLLLALVATGVLLGLPLWRGRKRTEAT